MALPEVTSLMSLFILNRDYWNIHTLDKKGLLFSYKVFRNNMYPFGLYRSYTNTYCSYLALSSPWLFLDEWNKIGSVRDYFIWLLPDFHEVSTKNNFEEKGWILHYNCQQLAANREVSSFTSFWHWMRLQWLNVTKLNKSDHLIWVKFRLVIIISIGGRIFEKQDSPSSDKISLN